MKRPSFLALPRPVICCILKEPTVESAIATIKNGEFKGAPAFAIHLEGLPNDQLTYDNFRRIAGCTKRPVMFLRYRHDNSLSDEERVEVLKEAVRAGAAAVDFTADTFDPSPMEFSEKPEIVEKQKKLIDEVHKMGAEVVMSSHIVSADVGARTCEQVLYQMKAVEARGVDYAKIVTLANTEEEFLEALRTTMALRRELKVPFIHLCGGKFALPQRYIGPMLGNALTFCTDHYTAAFTTTQPPIVNMRSILESANWNIADTEE